MPSNEALAIANLVLSLAVAGIAFFCGMKLGRREAMQTFIEIARDPMYLDLTTAVAQYDDKNKSHEQIKKELQAIIDERINYYKSKSGSNNDRV